MWGVTGAAYLRIMEPQYDDGVGTPRSMNIDGNTLPDGLTISSKLLWTQVSFWPIFCDSFKKLEHFTNKKGVKRSNFQFLLSLNWLI